ncbi:hypothetical protein CLV63_112126 [Murinocardiopsis flavida]|uniref:Uncharacterized protein n=1 Tax=Murinocardiopsis flavida TaxID=645275 RepID=A0A2P8DGA1_9ACTN|nr:hypothetical protein CLV63_112126 [Murinocardiopsis flavida]
MRDDEAAYRGRHRKGPVGGRKPKRAGWAKLALRYAVRFGCMLVLQELLKPVLPSLGPVLQWLGSPEKSHGE